MVKLHSTDQLEEQAGNDRLSQNQDDISALPVLALSLSPSPESNVPVVAAAGSAQRAVHTTGNPIEGPEFNPDQQGESGSEQPLPVPVPMPGASDRDGGGPSSTEDLLNLNSTPEEEPWQVGGGMLKDAGEMHRRREVGKELMLLAEQQARRVAVENQGVVASVNGAAPGSGFSTLNVVQMHEYVQDFGGSKHSKRAASGGREDGGIRVGGAEIARAGGAAAAREGGGYIWKKKAGVSNSCSDKFRTAGNINPNSSDSGGGSSSHAVQKREKQRGKAVKKGLSGRVRGRSSENNKGAMEGMETHASKSSFDDKSGSVKASQSANEQNVTTGRQAVSSHSRLIDHRRVRREEVWSGGPGSRSSGEDDDSCGDRQEGVLSEKDERVKEEGGGGCGSGVSAESDSGELLMARKKPGPSRKRGPVSKGCIDSRVSCHCVLHSV